MSSVEPKDVALPPSLPSTPKKQPAGSNHGARMTSSSSVKAKLAMFEQQASTVHVSPRPVKAPKAAAPVVIAPEPSTSKLPVAKPGIDSKPTSTADSYSTQVWGIVLVDFDHALGPKIEYSYPTHLQEDADLATNLPFLALPDGAHLRDEDYSYFHMLCPTISASTIFGISCNRQLPADQLKRRSKVVTRSTVQKAIVVLASKPVFGPIRDKLGVITRAFFAQKDFEETEILVDFYASLEGGLQGSGMGAEGLDEMALYMGTSIRELIHKFRFKTLMLLKLLLLQRKVMFYGQHVERLCTFQYSLVSLIPLLLNNLEDAASPSLPALSQTTQPPTELRSSDRRSLLNYLGLPLHIFGAGCFFQPYLPLQQIDLLQEAQSYLVGTTNSIFQQQRESQIDVLVNIDTATIDFIDPTLAVLVNLTAPDRKWMDEIVSTVSETWNAADPARPLGMKFVGSDDYLRAKFEEYICSALSAVKFADFIARGPKHTVLLSQSELAASLSSYNEAWVAGFQRSPAFNIWNSSTDDAIFDLVEPRHPCEGNTNLVQDVGIRLVQGVHDLHLDQNLEGAKEVIGKGIQTGTQSVLGLYSNIKSDLSKRQAEYNARKEKEAASAPVGADAAKSPAAGGPLLSNAVTEASTKAASLATSVGSFFATKRSQFFAPPTRSNSADGSLPPPQELKTPPLRSEEFAGATTPDSFPPPSHSADHTTPAPTTSSFSSFWRASPTTATPSPQTETPAPVSSFPSFFRRVTPDPPKSNGLRELSLSSSPVFERPAGSSPKLSPRLQRSPRPSSHGSNQSDRSSLSKDYEQVQLPP